MTNTQTEVKAEEEKRTSDPHPTHIIIRCIKDNRYAVVQGRLTIVYGKFYFNFLKVSWIMLVEIFR